MPNAGKKTVNWPLTISILGFALSLIAFLQSYGVTIATQRAFVSIKEFQTFVLANNLIIMPRWQNTGGTPTRKMTNHANWKYFPGAIPEDFDFKDLGSDGKPDDGKSNQPMFIAPKGDQFSETLRIPIEFVDLARTHRGQILMWGWTEYDDVFLGTLRHRTEFENVLEVTNIAVGNDKQVTAGLSFRQYKKHNCADGECK